MANFSNNFEVRLKFALEDFTKRISSGGGQEVLNQIRPVIQELKTLQSLSSKTQELQDFFNIGGKIKIDLEAPKTTEGEQLLKVLKELQELNNTFKLDNIISSFKNLVSNLENTDKAFKNTISILEGFERQNTQIMNTLQNMKTNYENLISTLGKTDTQYRHMISTFDVIEQSLMRIFERLQEINIFLENLNLYKKINTEEVFKRIESVFNESIRIIKEAINNLTDIEFKKIEEINKIFNLSNIIESYQNLNKELTTTANLLYQIENSLKSINKNIVNLENLNNKLITMKTSFEALPKKISDFLESLSSISSMNFENFNKLPDNFLTPLNTLLNEII
ncbi:MAG: hypothetical protein ACP5O4_08190, partial [bacterium]